MTYRRVEFTPELLAQALQESGDLPEDVEVTDILKPDASHSHRTYYAVVRSDEFDELPEGGRIPLHEP